MRDFKLFIKDMIAALTSIENFVEGMTIDQIVHDDKTSSAVIRKFEVMGEAARNLPVWLKEKYQDIPWKSIAGMRDRLIHGYFGIDYELVWQVIKIEFPGLKKKLITILEKIEEGK